MTSYDARASAPRPKVSIVMPFRNARDTIAQTLASVREQSFVDWELIAFDDRSTDDGSTIVAAHAARDSRVRRITATGVGVSAARNAGVAAARGELVAFIDADDLWVPAKLDLHVGRFARESDLGVSFDRVRFVDAQGWPTPVTSKARGSRIQAAALLRENPACTASTLVMRRRTFDEAGGFDTGLAHAEDLELMLRVACRTGWRIAALPKVLTHYRASPAGASADLQRMLDGWERVVRRVETYAPALVASHFASARAVQLRYLARRALRLGQSPTVAAGLLRQAWHSSPVALLREPYRSVGTALAVLWRAGVGTPGWGAAR